MYHFPILLLMLVIVTLKVLNMASNNCMHFPLREVYHECNANC